MLQRSNPNVMAPDSTDKGAYACDLQQSKRQGDCCNHAQVLLTAEDCIGGHGLQLVVAAKCMTGSYVCHCWEQEACLITL